MQAAFDTNGGSFVNNEFIDVYLVTVKAEVPIEAFTLQEDEVAAVRQGLLDHLIQVDCLPCKCNCIS